MDPFKATSYERLLGAVVTTVNINIFRRYKKEYIPGWSDASEHLYQEFFHNGNQQIADELIERQTITITQYLVALYVSSMPRQQKDHEYMNRANKLNRDGS